MKISPSILAADYANFEKEVRAVEQAGASMLHVDVMDGHFVNQLTFGPGIVAALRPKTSLVIEIHLMVTNPMEFVEPFAKAGADIVTIHYRPGINIHRIIDLIHSYGMGAGLAVPDETNWNLICEYLPSLEFVNIMTVSTGYGGQKFNEDNMEKLKMLKLAAKSKKKQIDFAVDGGVNFETAAIADANGADVLIAGTSIFGAKNYYEAIEKLKCRKGLVNL